LAEIEDKTEFEELVGAHRHRREILVPRKPRP